MANEIQADYSSNNTLYAVVRNLEGDVWYPSGQLFEAWGTDGHDAGDYCIALVDKDGSKYVGDFDSQISKGRYSLQVFLQSGANPADGDDLLSSRIIIWTGNAELTCDKILANKAVQDKITGAITYYDDDGETGIFTHNADDSQSTISRTPV
jgi:hypothetical protein